MTHIEVTDVLTERVDTQDETEIDEERKEVMLTEAPGCDTISSSTAGKKYNFYPQ